MRTNLAEGQPEGLPEKDLIVNYESVLLCPATHQTLQVTSLLSGKNLKGLQLVTCKDTDTAFITFNSKQLVL